MRVGIDVVELFEFGGEFARIKKYVAALRLHPGQFLREPRSDGLRPRLRKNYDRSRAPGDFVDFRSQTDAAGPGGVQSLLQELGFAGGDDLVLEGDADDVVDMAASIVALGKSGFWREPFKRVMQMPSKLF